MSDETDAGLKSRLQKQSEDALGKLAQDLLDNPMISGALSAAFDAREKASQAQTAAMGALNIPSAADVERLTRRIRSISQRLEGIEDGLDRISDRMPKAAQAAGGDEARLSSIEEKLDALSRDIAELREAVD